MSERFNLGLAFKRTDVLQSYRSSNGAKRRNLFTGLVFIFTRIVVFSQNGSGFTEFAHFCVFRDYFPPFP